MKKQNNIPKQKEYGNEKEEDILNYSLSAIVRAIPDLRDGLKPVHRRILYVMKTEHNTYDKAYRKTVKTVGSTLSRFHPHGLNWRIAVYKSGKKLGTLSYFLFSHFNTEDSDNFGKKRNSWLQAFGWKLYVASSNSVCDFVLLWLIKNNMGIRGEG